MKNNKTLLILIAVFVVVLVGGAVLYNTLSDQVEPENMLQQPQAQAAPEQDRDEAEQEEPQELTLAPDFTVVDWDDAEVNLSDFYGTPVVLNFWASWCPPCKSEMPEFDKVYQEMEGKVAFMMVDMVDGAQETKEKGRAYIEEQGFSFPVYFDVDQQAAYLYRVSSIPTTLFIDAEGHLVTAGIGMLSEDSLRRGIDMILEE